jgi:hypothetical protein
MMFIREVRAAPVCRRQMYEEIWRRQFISGAPSKAAIPQGKKE